MLKLAVLSLVILIAATVHAQTQPAFEAEKMIPPANPALPTIWIIGDSTVHNSTPPLVGWGDVIGQWFDTSRINIVNRAIPGRSSRSFINEGHWTEVLDQMKPGDYLLMQFGHNDESVVNEPPDAKSPRSRGTIPGIGDESVDIVNTVTHKPETVHTFGYYMRKYVSEAKAKNVKVMVCSYVPRLPKKFTPTTQPAAHSLWAKQIADEQGATFLDIRSLVWKYWAQFDVKDIKEKYFPKDGTHTNADGAAIHASAVTAAIRADKSNPLNGYLRDSAPQHVGPTTKPSDQ